MAKVYSWEVSKNPTKYAYIVNPKDFNKAYIGSEPLTGNNLEKVKKWATDCTDEEYETQFQKMVTLCAEKGLNVEFETVFAYMNVDAPCDNLRGPAGRGIDHIDLLSTDNRTRISKYIIYYDDGTNDTFEIQNGFDGKDGINGEQGAQGDAGVSSKLVMIYTSGVDENGKLSTPSTPEGGSYNFENSTFKCPDGWYTSDTNSDGRPLTPPIWMSSRVFSSSDASTDKNWSPPVQISGEKGEPGVDGITTEFIYKINDGEPSVSVDDLYSDLPKGWTASPTGVDEDNLTEWYCIRNLNRETNKWGQWEGPFIWSKYGVNGQDGDGVQYIFLINTGDAVPNPTPLDYNKEGSKYYNAYQSKTTEWLPPANEEYTNKDGDPVTYSTPSNWTDNPSDLTSKYHSQWVSSRKYRKNSTTEKMEWGPYSDPALWARFGQDGKNATTIRKLYTLTNSTSEVPSLPGDSTTTSVWGTGFPVDYVVGTNVVWGTEAEIWAHNFEFVYSYKIKTIINADGTVVHPSDRNDLNSKKVDSIPDEKVDGFKYLIFGGNYYEWTGGWCKPYLVTGVKGETPPVPSYTMYAFAYGDADNPPSSPPIGIKPGDLPYTYGNVLWEDFPDTSSGGDPGIRIDGAIVNGKKKRWYQCTGYVNGTTKLIESWGQVVPCNGQDGPQGGKGDYMEIRFGVTADEITPELKQYDGNKTIREPILLNEKGDQKGWYTTSERLPRIPKGGAMWQIWAFIDGETNTVKTIDRKGWNGPTRVSGEKGEQGIQGPAGMRGATGIPGAKLIQMYCLGTYGKNETSESYWGSGGKDGGDGYFGGTEWENGISQDDMEKNDWFIGKEMPYSTPLNAYNLDEVLVYALDPTNKGRVVKLIVTTTQEEGLTGIKSSFTNTTYTYYLINSNSKSEESLEQLPDSLIDQWTKEEAEKWVEQLSDQSVKEWLKQLTRELTYPLESDKEFDIYMWCIQGNEKWKTKNEYVEITEKNEDGDVILPDGANSDNTTEVYKFNPSKKLKSYKYVKCGNKYYQWEETDGDERYMVISYYDEETGKFIIPEGANSSNTIEVHKFNPLKKLESYEYVKCGVKYYQWKETEKEYVDTQADGANSDNTIEVYEFDSLKKYESYEYVKYGNEYYQWVEYNLDGINWGSPFKLQGTNGLRGLTGSRGQVVYPMGVYNQEEVYITTADKAPYVYDPNDGMFYVYNIVGEPWVGVLPGYNPETKEQGYLYKTIMVHPGDVSGNFLKVTFNPESSNSKVDTDRKYLYYIGKEIVTYKVKDENGIVNEIGVEVEIGKYYIWNDNSNSYSMASRYKYSKDGSGHPSFWMGSKNGDSPANNYANAINGNYKPAWVRFESFQALYTSIGIIENGLIGSAVFNNEFMFSQQGIDEDGHPTNYAVVSGQGTSYGFLSGYEYNETGYYVDALKKVLHWHYAGTDDYIDEFDVDPYEKNDNDAYIHTFMPNVCINFATGQMWLSAGQIKFGSSGERNILTIDEVGDRLRLATDAVKTQIDKSAYTYYQPNDPSKDWQLTDAPERIGDLWFNTDAKKSYIFAHNENGIPNSIIANGTFRHSENEVLKNADYYWLEFDLPDTIYNRINGRSKIFVQEPTVPYYVGDLWFVHSDKYKDKPFYDGENTDGTIITTTGITQDTCMICMKASVDTFNTKHWGKRYKYADEADVQNAQKELDDMTAQLSDWADDNYINPTERALLQEEYEEFKVEYPSILKQAEDLNLGSDPIYSKFLATCIKAKDVFDYYTDKKHATSGTKNDCIVIYTSGDDAKNYQWIARYYIARQALLELISQTLNSNTTEGLETVRSEFTVADNEIKAMVEGVRTSVDGQLVTIRNEMVTDEKMSGLISTALENERVITKATISASIKNEAGKLISEANISADNVYINGKVGINEVLQADDEKVTMSNVVINGSLCNPFVKDYGNGYINITVYDEETGEVIPPEGANSSNTIKLDYVPSTKLESYKYVKCGGQYYKWSKDVDRLYHDNFFLQTYTNDGLPITFANNLQWDKTQSGRKVTMVNHKWNNELSIGRVRLNSPSYFKLHHIGHWERGTTLTKDSIGIKDSENYFEAYTLESFHTSKNFKGSQDSFYFQIPSGLTEYSIYIKNDKFVYDVNDNTNSNYVIVSDINGKIWYEKGDGVTPHKLHTGVNEVLQDTKGEYTKITFTDIKKDAESIVSIIVKQNAPELNKYIATLLLPKDSPDKMFFYENGQAKQTITLSRELVNLIGYGDFENFYGWIVENRADIETKYLYGKNFKTLAFGCIRYIKVADNPLTAAMDKDTSYVCTFDGTPVKLGRYEKGKYQIGFDSSWDNTLQYCTVLTTGYGVVVAESTNTSPSKATHMPFTKGKISGISNGIEVWVSDDSSLNDGSFYFLMTNYTDLPTLYYT